MAPRVSRCSEATVPFRVNPEQLQHHIGFYKGLVEGRNDNDLGKNLAVDDEYLTSLFKTTFGSGPMDKHQRSLACSRYRNALPVQDKLYKNGSRYMSPTYTKCGQNDEINLYALV